MMKLETIRGNINKDKVLRGKATKNKQHTFVIFFFLMVYNDMYVYNIGKGLKKFSSQTIKKYN